MYIAGQVLKTALVTFPNKVDGQQALAEKKAQLIYAALDAHSGVYKVVPDKSVRSRMNICFRVTHASYLPHSSFLGRQFLHTFRVTVSMCPKKRSSRKRLRRD